MKLSNKYKNELQMDIIQWRTVANALFYTLQKEQDPIKKKSMEDNLVEVKAELAALVRKQKGIQ